jgi:hypothetical protein
MLRGVPATNGITKFGSGTTRDPCTAACAAIASATTTSILCDALSFAMR